ncbi:MAG TPA: hypothetical protein VK447_19975 [Myxococcaceae bacterium]|nr:hypothetical protein [Myxococcaceae bacterium]
MIRFARVPEPPDFDAKVRDPGTQWLRSRRHDKGRLPSLWSRVLPELRKGFHDLCAYTATYQASPGTVDHYVPISRDSRQAFEWSNYRYAAPWINAIKKDLGPEVVLDPHEVEDDWFELLLPSCQLVVTDACPPERRGTAQAMLNRLKLGHGEQVIRYRLEWLRMYRERELTFPALEKKAPLVARAILKEKAELRRKRASVRKRRGGGKRGTATKRATRASVSKRRR